MRALGHSSSSGLLGCRIRPACFKGMRGIRELLELSATLQEDTEKTSQIAKVAELPKLISSASSVPPRFKGFALVFCTPL